ncbi:hypothetical protein CDD82_4250 [Ophiocordyceps australis]|uniref:Smr domain-containing protein n=1 Tax=Ophiocordyceps australis TaxID=1399860 RepID=A0A2C5ZPC7_9HYPO|nr:hypothetical protein CDD82_4250 [Ophiocordyceps australis]
MAGESETHLIQGLVDSFRSLLDEALIVAIANDYDLADAAVYDSVKTILHDLAQNVPSEEASGFSSSGIPALPEGDSDEAKDDPTASTCLSQAASQSQPAESSSSTEASSATADSQSILPRLTSFDNESDESKLLSLQSMFNELKEYDIQYSLKKANGNFQLALDHLLNVQYLTSTGQQMKGIDAFFKPDDDDDDDAAATAATSRNRKRKKKGKSASSANTLCGLGEQRASSSCYGNGQDGVEYVAERLGLRSDEVLTAYQKNNASLGATVVELLDQYISHGVETQDDAGKKHAEALMRKYRHVPETYMPTIVHVAGSIPKFADDLAVLLNKYFSKQAKGKKLDLSYRLTPLPQEDIEGSDKGQVVPVEPANTWAHGPSKAMFSSSTSYAEAMRTANRYRLSRRETIETAAQLHRRGAANPLYRQAASMYTERARDQARCAQQATSAAADILVEQQSTVDSIDLHGVLVHDGVRIALQRTRKWWQELGEFRTRIAKEHGFTVITGLGRHSSGGVSQLRKAVAAALLQDGWKLHVETGRFVVTGRR